MAIWSLEKEILSPSNWRPSSHGAIQVWGWKPGSSCAAVRWVCAERLLALRNDAGIKAFFKRHILVAFLFHFILSWSVDHWIALSMFAVGVSLSVTLPYVNHLQKLSHRHTLKYRVLIPQAPLSLVKVTIKINHHICQVMWMLSFSSLTFLFNMCLGDCGKIASETELTRYMVDCSSIRL